MTDPLTGALAFLCVASLALVVVVALLAARRRRLRDATLAGWAARNGWQLVTRPDVDWGRRLPGGNPAGVRLLLSGRVGGRPVLVGEYEVTDAQETHHWVVTVAMLQRAWPPATVTARRRLSRRDPAFDDAFKVGGASGPWLGPALTAAHLAGHVPVPWSVAGPELMAWTEGRMRPSHPVGDLGPILHLAALLDARGTGA